MYEEDNHHAPSVLKASLVQSDDEGEEGVTACKQFLSFQKHVFRTPTTFPAFFYLFYQRPVSTAPSMTSNLKKWYLINLLVIPFELKPTVHEKSKSISSLKFGNVQLLDIKKFLGNSTSLDVFLKAYKTSARKLVYA